MKLVTNFPNQFNACFIIAILLVQSITASAQEVHYRDPQNHGKGYWQLFTNATTRTTSVQFFDVNDQLLYEEEISNKFIKLTERNINKINQSFDQIAERKLVTGKVKFNSLTSADYKKLTYRNSLEKRNPEAATIISQENAPAGIKVLAYQTGDKANYNLTIENPNQDRLFIYVFNKVNKNVYWEKIDKPNYRRNFNFAGLTDEDYKLVVTTADKKYQYIKKIETKPSTQIQQVEQSVPTLITQIQSDY